MPDADALPEPVPVTESMMFHESSSRFLAGTPEDSPLSQRGIIADRSTATTPTQQPPSRPGSSTSSMSSTTVSLPTTPTRQPSSPPNLATTPTAHSANSPSRSDSIASWIPFAHSSTPTTPTHRPVSPPKFVTTHSADSSATMTPPTTITVPTGIPLDVNGAVHTAVDVDTPTPIVEPTDVRLNAIEVLPEPLRWPLPSPAHPPNSAPLPMKPLTNRLFLRRVLHKNAILGAIHRKDACSRSNCLSDRPPPLR